MDFYGIGAVILGIILATIVMVKFGWATHSSPLTIATSKQDKAIAERMKTTTSTGKYVI